MLKLKLCIEAQIDTTVYLLYVKADVFRKNKFYAQTDAMIIF
jgi:hypothetical protein